MRLLHFLCNRWKPILPPPLTVTPYALTGTAIRLNFKNPSQLGREGIAEAPARTDRTTENHLNRRLKFANVIPACRKGKIGRCKVSGLALQVRRVLTIARFVRFQLRLIAT